LFVYLNRFGDAAGKLKVGIEKRGELESIKIIKVN